MKVLIVKLSAVGDVLMSLPMLHEIRNFKEKAKITWICGKTVEPVIRATNLVDEVISVDENKLLTGKFYEKLSVLLKVWARLCYRHFDLALIAHGDPRYKVIALAARCKELRRFGRVKSGEPVMPIPGRYHGAEYARLARGESTDTIKWPTINVQPTPDIKKLLENVKMPMVCLAPGGARNILSNVDNRRWPLENYALLTKKLIQQGIRVAVTGANTDRWVCEIFAGLDVINLVGKTNLIELIYVYKNCALVITHDSGPFHIAYTMGEGTKTLGLFGPTMPQSFAPIFAHVSTIWKGKGLFCSPCYDGKTYAQCQNNMCMKSIEVDEVFAKAQEILKKL